MDKIKYKFKIATDPFDPYREIEKWQINNEMAAMSIFIGRVREIDQFGSQLKKLEIHHYSGLTEKLIEKHLSEITKKIESFSALVIHRVGFIDPLEPIVLIAVRADKRGIANQYCSEILEVTKFKVPFWKKEWTDKGSSWVKNNTVLST